ncbi:MAG TPA: hypothetical protein VFV75_08950 [Candidatus Polarisedimenticolaceae bacterium]|nr:hypothetical protein [Candidatus Polarisedimenticolaceae bacterium]
MREDEVDPVPFLIALSKSGVRWLLIGRQALIHYGAPVQTMDYDLWVDPAPANVGKLLRVARQAGLEGPESAAEVEMRPLFSLYGGTLKVDVFKVRRFTNLDGETIDFDAVFRRRVVAAVPGDPLAPALPSLHDLRRLKRMRDGEKDREDLRYLELLERRPRPRGKRTRS